MKAKAAWINESEENHLAHAYDDNARARLMNTLEFPEEVITPEKMEQYRGYLAQTEYLFSTWGMPALTEEQIRKYLPALKAVFYAAGTVQKFARPFLHCGVKVFSAWMANAVPVSEYTAAQIILAGKGFFQGLRIQEEGGRAAFDAYAHSFPANYNVKVGILGAGGIGSMVLDLLRPCHVEKLVYDPFVSEEKLQLLGAKRATLEDVFSECQTISCHIANLPATQKMLRYEHFSLMKKNATFINTGRGAQVVEEDLIRALREEPGRTAVLDVTWPEPPETDSPLLTMRNVILTPHIAGSMNNEIARMGEYMVQEYTALSSGCAVRWEVTEKMLETMA